LKAFKENTMIAIVNRSESVLITEVQKHFQSLVGIIDTGFNADTLSIDSQVYLGSDFIDSNNASLLAKGGRNEHGSNVLKIIKETNPKSLFWLGRAVGSGRWAESLIEFVDVARASGCLNAIINLSFDLVQGNS